LDIALQKHVKAAVSARKLVRSMRLPVKSNKCTPLTLINVSSAVLVLVSVLSEQLRANLPKLEARSEKEKWI
jgi:hypothetical protein